MKKESFFKFLFWFLSGIFLTAVLGVVAVMTVAMFSDAGAPDLAIAWVGVMILMVLLFLGLAVFLAMYIYKDAGKRGLPRWMWMTIALYVPNFIGLILYFVFRSNYEKKCVKCGSSIKYEYKICPYCGTNLNIQCPSCHRMVEEGWKVCPYCNSEIENNNEF